MVWGSRKAILPRLALGWWGGRPCPAHPSHVLMLIG